MDKYVHKQQPGKSYERHGHPDFTIWEVLEEYADVRDELEDLLDGFRSVQEDIEIAMFELADGLEAVEEHLARCDKVFRRFKVKRRREEEAYEVKCSSFNEEGTETPFEEPSQPQTETPLL